MATKRWRVEVDPRTDSMTNQVLTCRSMNHPWSRIPLSPARRKELLTLGQTESIWVCQRCGSERIDLFELPTLATLATRYRRCEGYDMAKGYEGTGRMPRRAARAALMVREVPELLAA